MNFILYTQYKNIEYVWRGIKTIPRPQELYRARTAPPSFEIPGSATNKFQNT